MGRGKRKYKVGDPFLASSGIGEMDAASEKVSSLCLE